MESNLNLAAAGQWSGFCHLFLPIFLSGLLWSGLFLFLSICLSVCETPFPPSHSRHSRLSLPSILLLQTLRLLPFLFLSFTTTTTTQTVGYSSTFEIPYRRNPRLRDLGTRQLSSGKRKVTGQSIAGAFEFRRKQENPTSWFSRPPESDTPPYVVTTGKHHSGTTTLGLCYLNN